MPRENDDQGEELDPPRHTLALPETIGDEDDDGYDLLGDEQEGGEKEGGEKDGKGNEDDPPDLSSLEQRLDQMQEQLQSKDQMISQLIGQRTPAQDTPPADTGGQDMSDISLEDLPDPVEKPKEFKTALAKKFGEVSSRSQQQSQQAAQQQQRQLAIQRMELDFQRDYEDLADRKALMRGAVSEEAQELRKQGVDSEQFIMNNQGQFLQRVADRMRKELGETGSDDGRGQSRSKQRSTKRTRGVSGGSAPSTSGNRGRKQEKAPSFTEQLKKTQHDMGLI